jgi:hypothetical protein
MKARPCIHNPVTNRFDTCPPQTATHIHLLMHGHFHEQYIKVNTPGMHPMWTWNMDVEKPTLSPSILTTSYYTKKDPDGTSHRVDMKCHTFIRGGLVEYLTDCTHEFAGKTLPLRDHPPENSNVES